MSPEDVLEANYEREREYHSSRADRTAAQVAVREAIEQHRDEVVRLVYSGYGDSADVAEDAAHEALDCLLARVEGKPWPPGGEKP